jgi:hypothetical protein
MPGQADTVSSETSTARPDTLAEDIVGAEDLLWHIRAAHTPNDTLSRLSENSNFARRYHPVEVIDALTCVSRALINGPSTSLNALALADYAAP